MTFQYPTKYYDSKSAEMIVPILLQMFSPQNVLDVGCGIGSFVYNFKRCGLNDVLGIDGEHITPELFQGDFLNFKSFDLRKPINLKRKFDLVLSLEVAEHIDQGYSDQFVANLIKHGDVIVFSAAIPGQGGNNHLNEQWQSYWSHKFKGFGYGCFDEVRPKIWGEREIKFWYRQNMLVYIKDNSPLAKVYQRATILDVVHPENYLSAVSQAKRAALISEGRVGWKIAIRTVWNTIKNKFPSF